MTTAAETDVMIVRRVFPSWSVAIPATMRETFVEPDQYWHAWDAHRSVSLTSTVLTDPRGRPIPPRRILETVPPPPGEAIRLPKGLIGWAVIVQQPAPARASTAISGLIARRGGCLLATVTADDLAWAERVWCTIKLHQ
jgi:hypothetical protein